MKSATINAKQLRAALPEVVRQVKRGARFTVLYRSQPAFRIVPVENADLSMGELSQEPLYKAPPLGRSKDGSSASEHDRHLYGILTFSQ